MTDMRKALRQAALLRNVLEGCLKAAPSPMTAREIQEWPSVSEQLGPSLHSYVRLSTQIKNLVKNNQVEQIGKGHLTCYRWIPVVSEPVVGKEIESTNLHVKINKTKHSLTFTFHGMNITIEVQ